MEITMKSRTQTVRVMKAGDLDWTLDVQQKPVCPIPIPSGYTIIWTQPNGIATYFYEEGDVERFEPGGITRLWMERPDLPYVLSLPRNSGLYVEFKAGGAVETRWNGQHVFWGPEEPALDVANPDELHMLKRPADEAEWEAGMDAFFEGPCCPEDEQCIDCLMERVEAESENEGATAAIEAT